MYFSRYEKFIFRLADEIMLAKAWVRDNVLGPTLEERLREHAHEHRSKRRKKERTSENEQT